MPTEFKLPELGENIESGDLVRLLIKPGASVAEGQSVMELETDKAVVEVPSSVTGTVGEVRVKEGDKLRVGQVIFTVENGAGQAKAASAVLANAVDSTPSLPKQPVVLRKGGGAAGAHGEFRFLWRAIVPRVQTAGTGREHRLRRSGAADDLTGRARCRRPAGDGT